MAKIVRMERSETTNSKSPMWRCVTDDGQRVNVFHHDDPIKNNFNLFFEAGYHHAMLNMNVGDVLNWTTHPIEIELTLNGKWNEITAVTTRPEGSTPDTALIINTSHYTGANEAWALSVTDFDLPVVILDTETTGLTEQDEIIDVGVINVFGDCIVNTLVQPSLLSKVTPEITALTGISRQALENARSFPDIYPALHDALNGKIWLIYNAQFDMEMLDRACIRHGLPPLRPLAYSCIMARFAEWHGELSKGRFVSKSLSFACDKLGIYPPRVHRAIDDATSALMVVNAMAEEYLGAKSLI